MQGFLVKPFKDTVSEIRKVAERAGKRGRTGRWRRRGREWPPGGRKCRRSDAAAALEEKVYSPAFLTSCNSYPSLFPLAPQIPSHS